MSTSAPRSSLAITRLAPALCGLALLALVVGWLFRSVLFAGGLLSFRDSLHFYYPLFDFIQQEWEAGRIPLWNPYSNGGEPLLASPTSSVFYPPKLLFFLPVSYWARYHAYILLHVLLAGATCGWVARRWGASVPAATLASLSYACGGNVLFNYTNVVFLCGATWLPLGLWSGARLVESRTLKHVPAFSIVLALMVLGGDPQLGYETGLLVALYAALLWLQERRTGSQGATTSIASPPTTSSRPIAKPSSEPRETVRFRRWCSHRLVILGAAAGLAGLLTAVQILPTRSANRQSIRAAREVPSSLWELPGFAFKQGEPVARPDTGRPPNWYDAMVGDAPPPAKHELEVYGYSFEPWRAFEFVWPNITGRGFPSDCRWAFILDWEHAVWVPSQYLGLWPFLLALSAWRLRRTDPRTRWLSLIVLLSFVAAWGIYGPGWLMAQIRSWTGGEASNDPIGLTGGVGGLYWLLTILLPGFADFRFPSKLQVLTTCGLSLLAAQGFDSLLRPLRDTSAATPTANVDAPLRRWLRLLLGLALVSGAILVAVWLGGDWFQDYLNDRKHSRNVTFDSAGAILEIRRASLQTLVIALLSAGGLWVFRRSDSPVRTRSMTAGGAFSWGLVLLTAVDLAVANSALIHTVGRAAWETKPAIAQVLERAGREHDPSPRPVRFARPNHWVNPSIAPKHYPLADRVKWQREMLVVRQNLPIRLGVVLSYGTLDNNEYEAWFDTLPLPDREAFLAPRRSYDAWGTSLFVVDETPHANDIKQTTVGLRTSWAPPDSPDANPLLPYGPPLRQVNTPADGLPDGVQILVNDSAFPPAWIVHRAIPILPIAPRERDRWLPIMAQLVYPQQNPLDLRTTAVIEDRDLAGDTPGRGLDWPTPPNATETCRITAYAPDRVELEATLAAEGVVVLSDLYTPDWQATVSTAGAEFRPTTLLQTNRTMRGIHLPPGQHTIRMVYRPSAFYAGAVVSLMSWLGALVAILWTSRKQTKNKSI